MVVYGGDVMIIVCGGDFVDDFEDLAVCLDSMTRLKKKN